jgi:phosphoenolpyruvate carboxykinase (GTP)
MDSQLQFFNSDKLTKKPIMAGLNYFLTYGARGGEAGDTRLLGEKKDVKPWLTWLERRANGEVEAIDSPIGYLPLYEDLQALFKETIDKEYPKDLYDKQFSLYIDNILARIELQREAYRKEANCPEVIFKVYDQQKQDLEVLKNDFGPIVTPDQLQK